MKYCPECGSSLTGEESFCPECGGQLGGVDDAGSNTEGVNGGARSIYGMSTHGRSMLYSALFSIILAFIFITDYYLIRVPLNAILNSWFTLLPPFITLFIITFIFVYWILRPESQARVSSIPDRKTDVLYSALFGLVYAFFFLLVSDYLALRRVGGLLIIISIAAYFSLRALRLIENKVQGRQGKTYI